MNIIIEGTDGCGKTTTIEALKTMFPKATFSDRNHDTICKYMLKDIPMNDYELEFYKEGCYAITYS